MAPQSLSEFAQLGYELVEEKGMVKHTCGHSVYWELLPGVSNEFLKAASCSACPCCGGETGHVPENLEWPDHAMFAGVGVAHCHEPVIDCKTVDRAHQLGRRLIVAHGKVKAP